MFFEVRIRAAKMMDNGMVKKVTETYIVNADTFGQAEELVYKELSPFFDGEMAIKGIRISNIREILRSPKDDQSNVWFIAKLSIISLDERSGREKSLPVFILILAQNINHAHKVLQDGMSGTLSDFRVVTMKETPIMDYVREEN